MNEKTETLLNNVRNELLKLLENIPENDNYKLYTFTGLQSEIPCVAMYISIGVDPYKNAEKYIEFNEMMTKPLLGWKADLLHYGEYAPCGCGKDRIYVDPVIKYGKLYCGYCGKELIWDGGQQL